MWTTIGFSSIYRVLSGLEEKGLIDTHLEHEGQGATRKVHGISADGKRALSRGVLDLLSSMKPMKNPFSVGLANITRAPRQEVLSRLKERISNFDSVEHELMDYKEKMLRAASESTHKDFQRARLSIKLVFDSALCHLQADKQFMNKILKLLKKEDRGIFEEIREEGNQP